MTLNVMGLDLSMTATGICLPGGSAWTVATDAKTKDRRLCVIRDAVTTALTGADPVDLVVMEEAPPGLKGPAIKAIHMVQGAVRTLLLDTSVPYAVVNPSTLKVYATGRKGADKTAMAMAAYKRAGLEFPDDNQVDAWWLRAMGLDRFGLAEIAMPVAQRAALEAVAWPAGVSGLRASVSSADLIEARESLLLSERLDIESPVTASGGACLFEAR